MITHLPFPLRSPKFANLTNRNISRQHRQFAIAMSLDRRITTRWNHRLDLPRRQRLVHLPLVIGTVAAQLVHVICRLIMSKTLLKETHWKDANIKQLLNRLPIAKDTVAKFNGKTTRGISVPLDDVIGTESEQDGEPQDF